MFCLIICHKGFLLLRVKCISDFFVSLFFHSPICSTLFYIDTGDVARNKAPKIYSSAMDGSSPVAIVTSNLHRPLYIAVDNRGVNGRIFWTDSEANQIMSATLDGKNARVVISKSPLTLTTYLLQLRIYYNCNKCYKFCYKATKF